MPTLFRNGLFCLMLLAVSASFSEAADAPLASEADGFKKLFNGSSLDGWEGDKRIWSIDNGAIMGKSSAENPVKKNTFLIWRGGDVKDFELRLRFKLEGKNNSGVQYRSKDKGNFSMAGYQCDLNSGGFQQMAKLFDEGGKRGRMAYGGEVVEMAPFVSAPKADKGKEANPAKKVTGETPDIEQLKTAEKKGDWNDLVIIAKGNHIIHKLNGITAIDFTDNDEANRLLEGKLGLQVHAGAPMTIWFKDMYVKELK